MAGNVVLYGPDNRPVPKDQLTEELAAPSVMGIRTVWGFGSEADHITPHRLATILSDAADGNADAYLTLAEEMEEREPHYGSVLGTRKRAISGLDIMVEAASEEKQDVEIADAVRELVRAPEFGEAVDDLLDGLGKGYSVVEILWNRGKRWIPSYAWRDPRFFEFSRDDGRTLLLIDAANPMGIALAPYKFIIHQPRLKSGLPIRSGLARLAAASYMCKSYTLKDWMAFAELFGMPLRLGRYNSNATQKDIDTLIRAVTNIGSDAAAVLPDTMRIDFQEAAKGTGGHELFLKLAEWLDRQVSKAVLGQTASTEGTPGKLGNEDSQADVRRDILKADAKALSNTLNRDLVRSFVDINFGRQEHYPRILLPVSDPENLEVLTKAIKEMVPLGLEVPTNWMRDKLGIPDPKPDAVLLRVPEAKMEAPPTAANRSRPKGTDVAMNRETPDADDLSEIEEEAMGDWQRQMAPVVNPILALADSVDSFDAFLEKLPDLDMDPTEVVKELALSTFKARAAGDNSDG